MVNYLSYARIKNKYAGINLIFLVLLIFLLGNIQASEMLSLNDGDIEVTARLGKSNTTVEFTLVLPIGYFVGIGFGTSMHNTPLFVVEDAAGGGVQTLSTYDCWAYKEGRPTLYPDNRYTITEFRMAKYLNVTVSRPLDITRRDNETNVIELDKELKCIWAFNNGKLGYHQTNRGGFRMLINSKTGKASFNTLEVDAFYKIHGIIMYITWSILTFIAIVSARYMKHLYKYKMIIHAAAGTLIASNTVIIVWLALSEYKVDGSNLRYGHSAIGIIVLVVVLIQFVGGIVVRQTHSVIRWQSKFAYISKMGHRLFGVLIVALANFQVIGGLYNYKSPIKGLIFLHIALYVTILLVFEISFRRRYLYKEKGVVMLENVPDITYAKFNNLIREGRKLVLFNNFIVDVETFMGDHPGTQFVISENIGNDIGKYFYGAYSVEDNAAPHTHSSYAANLLKKLTVGRIISGVSTTFDRDKQSNETKSILAITGNNLTFTVKKKEELNSKVARITFHGMDWQIEKIYPGLQLAGKSFSVTSLQSYVSRYYTLCNCMGSLIYDEYIQVINAILNDRPYSRSYNSYQEFSSKTDDCLDLIVKFYEQTQTGVSRQVHNATASEQFYIHGPVGRGLELNKFNSNGVNIIFSGGTGILPFMDLFAYIFRRLLSENDPNYEMFPGEVFDDLAPNAQFIIYAYFPNRDECLGIKILEGIENVHKKFGKQELFKLNLILTQKGDQKFTNSELVELLIDYKHTYGRVNKLWICGPPVMNVQFQRLMPEIKEKVGLDFEEIAIL